MKTNKWIHFAPLFLPEGEGGSGGTEAGSSGSGEGEGAAAVVAGDGVAAPAATFLTEKREGDPAPAPADEGKKEESGEATAESEAPASFDLTKLTLPEGFTLNEEVAKTFSEVLSDDKLSPQERGQKFIDLHTAALKEAGEAMAEQVKQANIQAYTELNNQWREQIKSLPEYKANPDAEAGKVMQALISVGAGEDFFKALDLTGAGNHPAIVQILHRLTAPYFEGTAVGGTGKPASTKRLGDNIYTSTNKP